MKPSYTLFRKEIKLWRIPSSFLSNRHSQYMRHTFQKPTVSNSFLAKPWRVHSHHPMSSNNVFDTNTYALKSFPCFLNEVSINAHQSVNGTRHAGSTSPLASSIDLIRLDLKPSGLFELCRSSAFQIPLSRPSGSPAPCQAASLQRTDINRTRSLLAEYCSTIRTRIHNTNTRLLIRKEN